MEYYLVSRILNGNAKLTEAQALKWSDLLEHPVSELFDDGAPIDDTPRKKARYDILKSAKERGRAALILHNIRRRIENQIEADTILYYEAS